MATGDIHTVHRDGKWFNEVEGSKRAANSATTGAEAQALGRDMARKRKVEHHIHRMDGRSANATPTATTHAARPAEPTRRWPAVRPVARPRCGRAAVATNSDSNHGGRRDA
jgi:hypothetical protein